MRRGLLIVLGALLPVVASLAAPAHVNASVYVHEVRFPEEGSGGAEDIAPTRDSITCSSTFSGSCANLTDGNDSTHWSSTNPANGRFITIRFPVEVEIYGWRILQCSATSCAPTSVTVAEMFTTACTGGSTVATLTGLVPGDNFGLFDTPLVGTCFRFTAGGTTATGGWTAYTLNLLGPEPEFNECEGQAGAGTGSGLVWGSAALTSTTHDQWGDEHVGAHEACLFRTVGGYSVRTDVVAGHTMKLGLEGRAYEGTKGGGTMWWELCEVGSDIVISHLMRIGSWEFTDLTQTAVDAQQYTVDAPGTACGIRITIRTNTLLRAVYIADHEGDPILDTGQHPSTVGGDDSTDDLDAWFADCDPPEDPLDVPGWLAFGACLVEMGFRMVVDWIGKVVTALAGGVGGFFGEVVVPGLEGIAGGIAGAFATVLDFLFVPEDIGDDWAAFLDLAETRVPFVYVAEVAGAVDDIDSSMAGSAAVFSFTVMGAAVSFDAVGLSDDLDIVRPALAGLVWLGLAWTVFHRVGGALGMSRSESSSVQSG